MDELKDLLFGPNGILTIVNSIVVQDWQKEKIEKIRQIVNKG